MTLIPCCLCLRLMYNYQQSLTVQMPWADSIKMNATKLLTMIQMYINNSIHVRLRYWYICMYVHIWYIYAFKLRCGSAKRSMNRHVWVITFHHFIWMHYNIHGLKTILLKLITVNKEASVGRLLAAICSKSGFGECRHCFLSAMEPPDVIIWLQRMPLIGLGVGVTKPISSALLFSILWLFKTLVAY